MWYRIQNVHAKLNVKRLKIQILRKNPKLYHSFKDFVAIPACYAWRLIRSCTESLHMWHWIDKRLSPCVRAQEGPLALPWTRSNRQHSSFDDLRRGGGFTTGNNYVAKNRGSFRARNLMERSVTSTAPVLSYLLSLSLPLFLSLSLLLPLSPSLSLFRSFVRWSEWRPRNVWGTIASELR